MTISATVVLIIFRLIILSISGYFIYECVSESETIKAIVTSSIALLLIVSIWIGGFWYFSHTESGKRAMKTQDSNLNSGIQREVIVYDMNGHKIEHCEGRFDVEYRDERVMFDDENGKRHIIYFKSGTVIINELL